MYRPYAEYWGTNDWSAIASDMANQSRVKTDQENKAQAQVVIIGSKRDFHSQHMYSSLSRRGVNTILLESRAVSNSLKLSWRLDQVFGGITAANDVVVPFSQINAVFWRDSECTRYIERTGESQWTGDSKWNRNSESIEAPGQTWTEQCFTKCIRLNLLNLLQNETHINWVNSLQSWQLNNTQTRQLTFAKQLGASIPKTLISNDAKEVLNFCNNIPTAIFRALLGGEYSEVLADDMQQLKRLDFALSTTPFIIQEYIPGTFIRCYVIGDKVFSCQVNTETIDFRQDPDCKIKPFDTPEKLNKLSRILCKGLAMQWTAIDWRRDFDGNYYF